MQYASDNTLNIMRDMGYLLNEKEKRIEETTTRIIEGISKLMENAIKDDVIFINASHILNSLCSAMQQRIQFLDKEIKIRAEIINPELYALHITFFFEIRKKTLKLQRSNTSMSNNRKVIVPLLWTTALVNPPATIGIILLYPLFYLATLPPTINQKFKTLKTEYEYLMKKPEKDIAMTNAKVDTVLREIQTNACHADIFEVFSNQEAEATKAADLKENYPKYNLQKNILIDFDYEQRLYDYYSTWLSRRMLCQFLLLTTSASLAWLAAKKINPRITNKTYRSYNNWYEDYRRKAVKSALHGIMWLLKKIDPEEDINDLKGKKS